MRLSRSSLARELCFVGADMMGCRRVVCRVGIAFCNLQYNIVEKEIILFG